MFMQNSKEEEKLHSTKNIGEDILSKATLAHQQYILKSSSEDLINAINLYIESIQKNPTETSAYYRLASLMHENGQIGLDGAIDQCKRAVEINPNCSDARMYYGYFLSLKGEFELAREQFKQAIKLKPISSARTRVVMALTMLERFNDGRKKDFISFSKAMYYILSGSLLFMFDKAGLKMFYKNVLNDLSYLKYNAVGAILEKTNLHKDAYKVYSDALDNTKNAPIFYEKMAKIAVKKDRPTVALQCYENAAKLSNNSPETLVDLIEFMQEYYPEKIDELIDSYTLLLKKVPGFSRCYYELGHLYLRKNEKINAVSAFKLALEIDQMNPFYQNSLAFAYVQLEQYDSAIELYKTALENNPDNEWSAVVAQALATIYHRIKGNFDAAISMLQHALALTSKKTEIYLALADVYYDVEDVDEAIRYYSIAIDSDEIKDAKVYSRLAMAFWEKDFAENAIELYLKAMELDPDYEIAYNNLGVIYLDAFDDYKRAMPYFEKALHICDEYTLAHFNLGRCHEIMNHKIEAANEYQMALDLNKIYPEIDEEIIQDRLYKLFEA